MHTISIVLLSGLQSFRKLDSPAHQDGKRTFDLSTSIMLSPTAHAWCDAPYARVEELRSLNRGAYEAVAVALGSPLIVVGNVLCGATFDIGYVCQR